METKPAKPSRKDMGLERKTRNIRLDNEEWEIFKTKLGTEWLRKQIAIASTAKSTKDQ